MLAKLGWEMLLDPNNIWVQVFSAKYLNKEEFLEIKKPAKDFTM